MGKRRKSKARKKASKSVSKRKTTRKKREVNIESWIDKYIDDFVSLTGLDILSLSKEEYKELLTDIITQLYGSLTSYSNVKTVAKRYQRYRDRINEVIAARLAAMLDKLTAEQLEFIVFNSGVNTALSIAPKIYKDLIRLGRSDLINMLRAKWRNAWISKRGGILPPPCPKCGFNSLMPDLSCIVCGEIVSDAEIRNSNDFKVKLKSMISTMECDNLLKLLKHSSVLYNDLEVKPPWERRFKTDVEVYLSSSEYDLIRSEYHRRCKREEGNGDNR